MFDYFFSKIYVRMYHELYKERSNKYPKIMKINIIS